MSEAELQAYVDRRLTADRASAVEAWLAGRASEAERLAAYRRINEALRAAYKDVLAEPVPHRLRIAAAKKPRWARLVALTGSVLIAAAIGALVAWELTGDGAPALVHRAALAHGVYAAEVLHPVELGADQKADLLGWLSKRLGMKVEAPNLDIAGLAFVGGRLLPGEAGATAMLMYETPTGARVSLYWGADTRLPHDTGLRYARENNVRMYYWIDSECGYAVVSSELDKAGLLRVATMAHEQLEK